MSSCMHQHLVHHLELLNEWMPRQARAMYLGSRVCFSCASVDRLNHWCEPEECLVQGTACSCEVTANDLGQLVVRGRFNCLCARSAST
jgi:hypothetical protein